MNGHKSVWTELKSWDILEDSSLGYTDETRLQVEEGLHMGLAQIQIPLKHVLGLVGYGLSTDLQ